MKVARVQTGPLVVGVIGVVLGFFYLFEALRFPRGTLAQPGPGFYSVLIGVLMMVAGLAVAIESAVGPVLKEVEWPSGRARWRVVAIVAVCLAYVVLLPSVGHVILAPALVFAILHILELASWPLKAALALVVGVGSYFLFVVLLGVQLPLGLLAS
jgi:putative tricarboxylic transport membrane protein